MIAFGCSITAPEIYERYAKPGIELVAESDSELLPIQAAGSIFSSYNLILEKAAAMPDLEALVLVHQDAEILDPDFCAKLRRALSDPQVAVVGAAGATGVRSIAWWEGSVTWASSACRYGEAGGGAVGASEPSSESWNGDGMPWLSWTGDELPPYARTGEVDTVHGFVMGLSPWTVRNVRFDESLGALDGYDLDLCLQVRSAGRKVVTADLRVAHHHSLLLIADPETWAASHMRVAEKWDGRFPGRTAAAQDWKQRARRAEAEAAAWRLVVATRQYQAEARAQQQAKRMKQVTDSASWRITEPLRRLTALPAAARGRVQAARTRRQAAKPPLPIEYTAPLRGAAEAENRFVRKRRGPLGRLARQPR